VIRQADIEATSEQVKATDNHLKVTVERLLAGFRADQA
jgi:hypothetical protein